MRTGAETIIDLIFISIPFFSQNRFLNPTQAKRLRHKATMFFIPFPLAFSVCKNLRMLHNSIFHQNENVMKTSKKKTTGDIAEMVTAMIIAKLEEGVIPWKKPWKNGVLPQNFLTKKTYRGINLLILHSFGHELSYYLTFKQVQSLGGKVRRGATSIPITYWNYYYKLKESGRRILDIEAMQIDPALVVKTAFLKYYRVFNVGDCDELDLSGLENNNLGNKPKIDLCEEIVGTMPDPPKISNSGSEAYYSPLTDEVCIPAISKFHSSEAYYNVLFHELIHSTGHYSRLNREGVSANQGFGSEVYSKEELIAEIGAGILSGYAGISDEKLLSNSAAYIQAWMEKLSSDKNLIFEASGKAQKAVDYILDICPF
jgi:antirestriction protein ArdC